MSTCQGIAVDQDIAGIGVRTAFYVQSISIVIAASIPGPDMKASFWSLTATSLAVLLYTLIQASMSHLTLHNAILVSYFTVLNSMASLCVWLLAPATHSGRVINPPTWEKYNAIENEPDARPNLGLRLAISTFYKPTSFPLYLQWIATYIYSFFIWSTGKTFGDQAACNAATKFLFFGIYSDATGLGRTIAIASLSLLFSLVAIPTVLMAAATLAKVVELGSFQIWKRAPKQARDPRAAFGRHTLPIVISFLYFWLYTVVIVEMTISMTATMHGPVPWTFRQIFPLVSVIVPLTGLYYALTLYLPQHLKKAKQAKVEKQPSEAPSVDAPLLPA